MFIEVKALVVVNKKTNEIIFAEGAESDGYSHHQVIIPRSVLTDNDIKLIEDGVWWNRTAKRSLEDGRSNINLGEMEANDYIHNIFESIEFSIKTIKLGVNATEAQNLKEGETLAIMR